MNFIPKLALLFLFLSLSAHSRWNPYFMDHERFVHLSKQEKQLVLIKTMEMMVELESKYQKEVLKTGYSKQNFEKYVQMLKKIEQFLLTEAVAQAASQPEIVSLAHQFSSLLHRLGASGCIYGGYVSKVISVNGSRFCRHPSLLDPKDKDAKAIKAAYLSNNKLGGKCVGPHKISCNPVVFGYQQSESEIPFCVSTGADEPAKAHNVSYECMRKALTVEGGVKTDSRDKRLEAMSRVMEGNRDSFNKVHNFIFRTCACGDNQIDGKKVLDQSYVNYMKPHRTCFGMMNSLRVIKNNECENLDNSSVITEFGDQWSRYFGNSSGFEDLIPAKTSDWDLAYGKLIDQSASKALCAELMSTLPEDPGAVEAEKEQEKNTSSGEEINDGQCSIEVKDSEDKESIVATLTLPGGDASKIEDGKWEPQGIVTDDKKIIATYIYSKGPFKVSYTGTLNGKILQCVGERLDQDTNSENRPAYALDVQPEESKTPNDKSVTLKAIVTIDGEDKTQNLSELGLIVRWSRKGPKAEIETKSQSNPFEDDSEESKKDKTSESSEESSTEPKDGSDSEGSQEKTNGDEKAAVDKNSDGSKEDNIGEGVTLTEDRGKTPHDVCAVLLDKEGKSLTAEDCENIGPLTTSDKLLAPLNEFQNLNKFMPVQPNPPPVFQAPVNNTRMFGIQ